MHERVEAVQMMARCTLAGDLGGDSQQEAESALTLVLDDPAISVRAALAWELALSDKAPRHLVLGLAHDLPEAAALVLARSPQLADADLVECARHGEPLTHLAIASRLSVPGKVSAALAASAGPKALIALLQNAGAEISDETLRTILSRNEDDPSVREALHARSDLPVDVRQRLITLVSADLLGFVQGRGWLGDRRAERTVVDARDGATIALASHADDLARYIAHLAEAGQLTPSLLIRSLLTGDTSLFGAALVCLADVTPSRVAGMLRSRGGSALAATCVRAGLSRQLVPVFTAALTAITEMPRGFMPDGTTLHRPIISRVLAACLLEEGEELKPVLAMLRRLDAELARADARAAIERMKAAEPILLDAVASALVVPEADAFEIAPVAEGELMVDFEPMAEIEPELYDVPAQPEPDILAAIDDIEPAVTKPAETLILPDLSDLVPDLPALVPVILPEPTPEIAVPEAVVATGPRVIRRPGPPAVLPADLEQLFADIFVDEPQTLQPLQVLEGAATRDEQYFAGVRAPAAKAA
jgi:uncharacterized protein (DUF2336 family)